MAISLANVATSDTFQTWLNTTNFLATYLTSSIVTVNSSFSSTTGNGAVVGSFGATTLFANSSLRGGNTSVSDTLNISSNTTISGTANVSGVANFTSSLTAANLTSSTNTATFGTATYAVSNGNFGIGTSTPGYKLSVIGTSGTQQAQIGTATSYLNVTGYTSNPTYVVVGGSTATQGIFGSETNIPVAIYTNNTEKVRVTAAGNVGISNTAPTHKLSVNGTTFLGDAVTLGSTLNITGTTTTAALTATNIETVGPTGGITSNGLIVAKALTTLSEGGEINLNNPDNASIGLFLDVSSADLGRLYNVRNNSTIQIGQLIGSNGIITFHTNASERLRIANSGNVGINTTTPGSTLDVKGTLRLSGSSSGYVGFAPAAAAGSTTYTLPSADGSSGQLLSTNGSGTLSWASAGGVTSAVAGTGVTVSASTGAVTFSIGQAVSTTSSVQFGSLGVGTAASGTSGEIRATNNITAYYSDNRLKTDVTLISDALSKVQALKGITYRSNDLAAAFGYTNTDLQVGVLAQDVEAVLPEIVKLAPFDTEYIDGKERSISGEHYKTVQYEKLVPLLIEAIKELTMQVEELKKKVT